MMTLKAREVLGWMSERSGTGVKDNISSLYCCSMCSLNFHSWKTGLNLSQGRGNNSSGRYNEGLSLTHTLIWGSKTDILIYVQCYPNIRSFSIRNTLYIYSSYLSKEQFLLLKAKIIKKKKKSTHFFMFAKIVKIEPPSCTPLGRSCVHVGAVPLPAPSPSENQKPEAGCTTSRCKYLNMCSFSSHSRTAPIWNTRKTFRPLEGERNWVLRSLANSRFRAEQVFHGQAAGSLQWVLFKGS